MIWFALTSIINTIGTAVASIGPALASFASGVGAVIANITSAIAPLAKALGEFASVFLELEGILMPGEKVEEVGERALQAAEQGITLGCFDDFDAYLEKLRDIGLDPDKAANRSLAEKNVAGVGVCTFGLERKFNVAPDSFHSLWLLPLSNPGYFTPERVHYLITTGKFTGDVFKYFEKTLSAGDSKRFEDSIGVGDASVYEALDQANSHWESIKQQIHNDKGE